MSHCIICGEALISMSSSIHLECPEINNFSPDHKYQVFSSGIDFLAWKGFMATRRRAPILGMPYADIHSNYDINSNLVSYDNYPDNDTIIKDIEKLYISLKTFPNCPRCQSAWTLSDESEPQECQCGMVPEDIEISFNGFIHIKSVWIIIGKYQVSWDKLEDFCIVEKIRNGEIINDKVFDPWLPYDVIENRISTHFTFE